MRNLFANSLSGRFLAIVVVSFTVLVVTINVFQARYNQDQADHQTLHNIESLFAFTTQVLAVRPELFESDALQDIVRRFAKTATGFERISIADRSLTILADSNREKLGLGSEFGSASAVIETGIDQHARFQAPQPPVGAGTEHRGASYHELSRAIVGRYNPEFRSNVIGVMTVTYRTGHVSPFSEPGDILILAVTAGSVLAVGVIFAFLVLRLITNPMNNLAASVQRFGAGDLGYRIDVNRNDEIGQLAKAFNHMAENLELQNREKEEAQAQLRQAQKLESIGQLTGGVAHDFNNILAVILGNMELLGDTLELDPQSKDNFDAVVSAADRAAGLTQHMLAFSRLQPLEPQDIDVNALISTSTRMLHRVLGETVLIKTDLAADPCHASLDPAQFESALLNLAINSRDAMPKGGELTIKTSNSELDSDYVRMLAESVIAGSYVLVTITDTGHGMSQDTLDRVFDPFFTTKPVGEGTGLGLSMVFGFIRQSGGHVTIDSEVGGGTTVRLYLPDAPRSDEKVDAQPVRTIADGTGMQVLLVEDDADVRSLATKFLVDLGYGLSSAIDGPEALTTLDRMPRLDILLTDVVLPHGMNGVELAEAVREQRPDVSVLYMSGYTEDAVIHDGRLDPDANLLSKPFRKWELAHKLQQIRNEAGLGN